MSTTESTASSKNTSVQRPQTPSLPRSNSKGWFTIVGAISLLSTLYLLRQFYTPSGLSMAPIILILSGIIPIVILEVLFEKVHRRSTTGLDFERETNPINWERVFTKLIGLSVTWSVVAIYYGTAPIYQRKFYASYFEYLKYFLPYIGLIAIPYFLFVDSRQKSSEDDAYWQIGRWFLRKPIELDRMVLKSHTLGWLVKAFFLPLMATFFITSTARALNANYEITDFMSFQRYGLQYVYLLDVFIAATGYIMTFKLLDSHIKSVDKTFFGWAICVMCYAPFWSGAMSGNFFAYNFDKYSWKNWLADYPTLLIIWGSILLCAKVGWAWANLCFGIRFSNLTHRGIITHGAFRLTKHPSYVCKNSSFWLIAIPFISPLGAAAALKGCLILLAVNTVYYFRAKTEEKHLSNDPVYVEYALWMNENGVFRWVAKALPFLVYKQPAKEPGSN